MRALYCAIVVDLVLHSYLLLFRDCKFLPVFATLIMARAENYHDKRAGDLGNHAEILVDPEPEPSSSKVSCHVSGSIGSGKSTTYSQDVWEIVSDLRRAFRSGRPRADTAFFGIVQGGNTPVVRHVLQKLVGDNCFAELEWITCATGKKRVGCWCVVAQVLLFALIFVATIILTPLCYLCHSACMKIFESRRRSLCRTPELPLVFALYSGEADMVELFLSLVSMADTDSDGNNVYHYLSEMSMAEYDRALHCHQLLLQSHGDNTALRHAITNQENWLGLTALEHCARYGSMQFFRFLTMQEGILSKASLVVSPEFLWIRQKISMNNDHENLHPTMASGTQSSTISVNSTRYTEGASTVVSQSELPNHAQFVSRQFDVSDYEQGDTLGKQSYLLQLLTARKLETLGDPDIVSMFRSRFLGKWMRMKSRRLACPLILYHASQTALTIIFILFLVQFGGDMNPYPFMVDFLGAYYSAVVDASVVELQKARDSLTSAGINPIMSQDDPSYLERILDGVKGISLLKEHPCETGFVKIGGWILDRCQARALNAINSSCSGYGLTEAELVASTGLGLLSNTEKSFDYYPFVLAIEIFILLHVLTDLLLRILFLCRNFRASFIHPWSGVVCVLSRRLPGSYLDGQLNLLAYGLFTYYLYVSRTIPGAFDLAMGRQRDDSLSVMKSAADVVPTNQSEAQSNAEVNNQLISAIDQSLADLATSRKAFQGHLSHIQARLDTLSYVLIGCLVLRFLLLIHSLRLVPGIGFFVVTIRRMAGHLLDFVVVYSLVALAFSLTFHFVMRNPECPVKRSRGFQNLLDALFSAYRIALGQGDYSYSNTNGKLVFLIYTVISVLLLLNLIIAVMSTTADSVSQEPRRQALCTIEYWDEVKAKIKPVINL